VARPSSPPKQRAGRGGLITGATTCPAHDDVTIATTTSALRRLISASRPHESACTFQVGTRVAAGRAPWASRARCNCWRSSQCFAFLTSNHSGARRSDEALGPCHRRDDPARARRHRYRRD
jgi:hypothetical protein